MLIYICFVYGDGVNLHGFAMTQALPRKGIIFEMVCPEAFRIIPETPDDAEKGYFVEEDLESSPQNCAKHSNNLPAAPKLQNQWLNASATARER